eukprot:9501571-Pyramimonas_sp.AAC.1
MAYRFRGPPHDWVDVSLLHALASQRPTAVLRCNGAEQRPLSDGASLPHSLLFSTAGPPLTLGSAHCAHHSMLMPSLRSVELLHLASLAWCPCPLCHFLGSLQP